MMYPKIIWWLVLSSNQSSSPLLLRGLRTSSTVYLTLTLEGKKGAISCAPDMHSKNCQIVFRPRFFLGFAPRGFKFSALSKQCIRINTILGFYFSKWIFEPRLPHEKCIENVYSMKTEGVGFYSSKADTVFRKISKDLDSPLFLRLWRMIEIYVLAPDTFGLFFGIIRIRRGPNPVNIIL